MRLRDSVSELIAPRIQTLRAIRHAKHDIASRGYVRAAKRTLLVSEDRNNLIVDLHLQVVVDRFLRGELQPKRHVLRFGGVIAKYIVSGKLDSIGAVPEQPFLARIKIDVDMDSAALDRQRDISLDLLFMDYKLSTFHGG